MATVDVLAIASHPDDIELICGGTLVRSRMLGRTTGIIDLTRGELGTRGSAKLRAEEAGRSAKVLGVEVRENLGLPDGGVTNTPETRARLAVAIRKLAPTIVITHSLQGRHPDHHVAAQLVRDACFVAGLANVEKKVSPHRPRKVLHALSYREDYQKPTFVVDISDAFEKKLEAIRCYASQFDGATKAGELYPNGEPLYDLIRHHAAHYGALIRARYGEPFYTPETMRVDDVSTLEVSAF
ncbi:MAG: bacillithiol biosynthesis deacetylase BshB1 [Gemmatimonadaceae bacterium]|nr:bacillithiol biosynthesis deacetylase BshB1 [Gemmatimonadaceae bacterium]